MLSLKQKIGLELNNVVVEALQKEHPLRQLFWECTLRCNLHCRHCGSDCSVSSLHKDMPWEDFRKVLLRIKESYNPHEIMIILSGGEPMMRSDIFTIGREIYEMEFPWGMVSNGRLITPVNFDKLIHSGIRSATISLDGFKDVHDAFRGVSGSFDSAVEAIKMFIAAKDRVAFDVVTCGTPDNLGILPELKEFLVSIGLKAWRLFAVFPSGRAASAPSIILSPQQVRQMMDFIVACRKEGRIRVSFGCEGFLEKYEGKVRDHFYFCSAGLSIASVRIDGSISACTSIRSDFSQGNIYTDDFIDVWENRFQKFRNREWMKNGKCATCRHFKYCKGGGMHLRGAEGELLRCSLDWFE